MVNCFSQAGAQHHS